ncbi:hypothetical protein [Novosphingobium sp. M1R2S20]|uniref:Uncharacterized protein n=1 Tax=Novosphingobium rhizovicinum TaxID=3228928 RepID=A0ABV3REY2_9SPHN
MHIAARAAIVPLILMSGTGCSKSAEEADLVWFTLNGVSFEVPSHMIRSVRYKTPGFVRINDSDGPIEIAFDAQLQGRTDRYGAPLLFSINDGEYPGIAHGRSAGGALVVCRFAATAVLAVCGSQIQFGGADWTVLFPTGQVAEADKFRQRAIALLQRFRVEQPGGVS